MRWPRSSFPHSCHAGSMVSAKTSPPLPCRHFPVRATVRGMSTLTEIEAAVETLSLKQQRKLMERLAAKLTPRGTLPKPQLSAHDLMKDGCGIVRSGKRDLSTNKKHMQGYGR